MQRWCLPTAFAHETVFEVSGLARIPTKDQGIMSFPALSMIPR